MIVSCNNLLHSTARMKIKQLKHNEWGFYIAYPFHEWKMKSSIVKLITYQHYNPPDNRIKMLMEWNYWNL